MPTGIYPRKPWGHSQSQIDHLLRVGMATRFKPGGGGENHPRWKGGIRESQGYRYVRQMDVNWRDVHPGSGLYRAEHILIAERILGRRLQRGEIVHHINGNGLDNRNRNLLICRRGYHKWLHDEMARRYMRDHFGESACP